MGDSKWKFAIVKATEGYGGVNSKYVDQMAIFRQAEFLTGAYHFAWQNQDPVQELDHFIQVADLRYGEIPVLDIENWDQAHNYAAMQGVSWAQRLDYTMTWLTTAEDRYGAPPWIYLNWDGIKGLRGACGMTSTNNWAPTAAWLELTHFPLWIAEPAAPGQNDFVSGGWDIVAHQYATSPWDSNYMKSARPDLVWWASGIRNVL